MRKEYLGDALDFWKGTFLELLRKSQTPAVSVKILPMFTDSGWTSADLDTYSTFLAVDPADILTDAQISTPSTRPAYFAPFAASKDDVFVDPDTGVKAKPGPKHIAPAEVWGLLSPDNVVAVYQHRTRTNGWVQHHRQLLLGPDVIVTGYVSAQVGMLFVTHSQMRANMLRSALTARLGAVAVARLIG